MLVEVFVYSREMNHNVACVVYNPNASVGEPSETSTPSPVRERAPPAAAPALQPVPDDVEEWDTDVTTAKLIAGLEDDERVSRSMPSVVQSAAGPPLGFPAIRLEGAFADAAPGSHSAGPSYFTEQLPPPTLFGNQSSSRSFQGTLLAPLDDMLAGRPQNTAASSAAAAPFRNGMAVLHLLALLLTCTEVTCRN